MLTLPSPFTSPQPPAHANFWMRLLPESATKTFPLPSTATPSGPVLNCPSPLPRLPHLVTKGQGSAGSHTEGTHPQVQPRKQTVEELSPLGHVPPHVG